MLSWRSNIIKEDKGEARPLLRLAMLDSCELVWMDARIIEHIKIAIGEDSTLESLLAFFKIGSNKAPFDI